MSDATPSARQPVQQQAPPAGGGAPHVGAPGAQSAAPRARRVLGIQPVLLVGIVLLTLVTLLTIVLIFVGDVETQAPRVVWTVIAFLGFTALLALDLALSRRSALPLVIGVAANVYLLAVLMLATWVDVRSSIGSVDSYDPYESTYEYEYEAPLGIRLVGVYLLAVVVVRAAAAGAWALVALGRRGVLAISRVVGIAAAVLLGLAGVLLTLHLAITPFGIEVGDLYWRCTVAIVVLAALAACVTTLLYWSRRQLEPRPELVPISSQPGAPQHPQQAGAHPGWGQQGWPQPGGPPPGWPQDGAPQGWPQHGAPGVQQVPNPMQPARPAEQQPPHAQMPQQQQQQWGPPPQG
jgi:hypothetical protein